MTPTSRFYVGRHADAEFAAALGRRPGILRLKGSRQTGKSSLLARAALLARQSGFRVALTDLQTLTREQTRSRGACLRALAESLSDQLGLAGEWDGREDREETGAAGPAFRRFLRERALSSEAPPLLWILDDVDRLFGLDFREELFALFRSWYNERAFDPSGPFSRLTLLLAYATEAYLFIRDLNQSPFNVGVGITLDDFYPPEVAALNERFGSPLTTVEEISRFLRLLGGHPYLVQVGMQELLTRGLTLDRLETLAASEGGPFGEHLRRLGAAVDREPDLRGPLLEILRGHSSPELSNFHRLRSRGVVAGASELEARLRCGLYDRYLRPRLEARS